MIYFKEEQRFNQWWLWVLMISANLMVLGLIITHLDNYQDFTLTLLLGFVPLFLASWLLFSARLKVEIKNRTIYYKFAPFHRTWRKIRKHEIERFEITEYKPVRDYGGWGIRASFSNHKALNVRGNKGLKVYFGNKKSLLIGTQKPEVLLQTMQAMMNEKEEDYG